MIPKISIHQANMLSFKGNMLVFESCKVSRRSHFGYRYNQ
jgi:hypothetical protein